jgi:hypothetical protein
LRRSRVGSVRSGDGDDPALVSRVFVFKPLGQAFEVLGDAGPLDMELRTSDTSPQKITLGVSQSNDATRILPPSSRLTLSVVLSVVPNFSRTFSTKTLQGQPGQIAQRTAEPGPLSDRSILLLGLNDPDLMCAQSAQRLPLVR